MIAVPTISGCHRSAAGTVLIIVAGISGLLASLALAFIARVQSGVDGSVTVVRETQARLMLHAACAYVLESGRMGYGPNHRLRGGLEAGIITDAEQRKVHREGHGWVDVRDDGIGPKDQRGLPVWTGVTGRRPGCWPEVGGTVVCPMYRWQRPPYAIRNAAVLNPIETDPAGPRYGFPYLIAPDPQYPGFDARRSDHAVADGAAFASFRAGDATPVPHTVGKSWFRVHRLSAARFIITCGAGGTMGFRDWNEVLAPHRTIGGLPGGPELFDGNPQVFAAVRQTEVRLWYEIQWSAAVKVQTANDYLMPWEGGNVLVGNINNTQRWEHSHGLHPNHLGTLAYIQRLDQGPDGPVDADGKPLPW